MIRAAVFAGIVAGAVWATELWDRYIKREDNDDDQHLPDVR